MPKSLRVVPTFKIKKQHIEHGIRIIDEVELTEISICDKKSLKIAVLTESRADYGVYFPLLKALSKDNRFELRIIITGMHTQEQYGDTENEVFNDFRDFWQGDSFGNPDWLIVLGDRLPMLQATIEAASVGIAVAHIQGGDKTGNIDNSYRKAISAIANIHFPCSPQSAHRLVHEFGEDDWRVHVVGPLGIYAMPAAEFLDKEQICQKLELDATREIVLVIQHPVSTQVAQAGQQMRATLEAVKDFQAVVIYPNNDSGSEAMIKEIAGIKAFKSLPYLTFVSLLKASDVIVGNSSTGLYEAPYFGIPAVNIGTRQQNREHGNNIIDVPHDSKSIEWAILNAEKKVYRNPFAFEIDGVKVILDTLASTPIDERLLQK